MAGSKKPKKPMAQQIQSLQSQMKNLSVAASKPPKSQGPKSSKKKKQRVALMNPSMGLVPRKVNQAANVEAHRLFAQAALFPMTLSSAVPDIPDNNNVGTASQLLKALKTIFNPQPGGGSTWDINFISLPYPTIAFAYSVRSARDNIWSPYELVPTSTYVPNSVGESFAEDAFVKSVAKYRCAGEGFKFTFTGSVLNSNGRTAIAQLPLHTAMMPTPLMLKTSGGETDPVPFAMKTDADYEDVTSILPLAGTSTYRTNGYSAILGEWMDLPPGEESQLMISSTNAINAPSTEAFIIRSDFSEEDHHWRYSTERLQMLLSRRTPDDPEIAANAPTFYPVIKEVGPDGAPVYRVATDLSDDPKKRVMMSRPLNLKTTSLLYTGLASDASITIEMKRALIVDPQTNGPLAPNRQAPVSANRPLLDSVVRMQQRSHPVISASTNLTHAINGTGLTPMTSQQGRGQIGNIISTVGNIAGTISGHLGFAPGGMIGDFLHQIGGHLPF